MLAVKVLCERGFVTEEQLQAARQNKSTDQTLLKTIVDFGIMDEERLGRVFQEYLGIEYPDLSAEKIDPDAFKLLSVNFMKENCLCLLNFDEQGRLRVAMPDPTDVTIRDMLRDCLLSDIVPVFSPRLEIIRKIDGFLTAESQFSASLDKVKALSAQKIYLDDSFINENSAILNADQSPVVELVNNIIHDGIQENASDIHIEPSENDVELRYRIDGRMHVKSHIPKSVHRHIISRLKILSVMDITETRRPQDGRMQVKFNHKNINLRVSVLPTIFGEKIVLRILDPGEVNVDIDHLGLDAQDYLNLQSFIKQPQGMILVCGPTGSGKTTTLYSALKAISSPEKNVISIEDPVEYTIEGVNQIQVNEKIDFTFANGLRTILRQDPDVILVGEIRDEETAQIAFRSSLTGHLVLSSLHTNGSIAAITRLLDMGIEPFIIASSMLGVISQRLVRVNCEHCRKKYMPPAYLISRYKKLLDDNCIRDFYKGEGCPACRQTGFKGRAGVFEFLVFSEQIKRMICNRASENEIKDFAVKHMGFRGITESGIIKVVEGVTTLEEMDSVLGRQYECSQEGDISIRKNKMPELLSDDESLLFRQRKDPYFAE